MIKTKLFITVGIGGSRIDFVAGWLGSLPDFVDSQWRIDPYTGRSFGLSNCINFIDRLEPNPNVLASSLKKASLELDPTSSVCFSASCHGYELEKKLTTDDLNAITIIRINTGSIDYKQLWWEFVVKTYMSKHRGFSSFENQEFYNLDQILTNLNKPINDQARCEFVETTLNQFNSSISLDVSLAGLPVINIDYADVISPNGSQILCDKLGLNVDESYHRLWKANLLLAKSPNEIECFGKRWSINCL